MYLSKVFKVVLLLSLMALVIPLSLARGQVTVGTAMIEESETGASDMLVVKTSIASASSPSTMPATSTTPTLIPTA